MSQRSSRKVVSRDTDLGRDARDERPAVDAARLEVDVVAARAEERAEGRPRQVPQLADLVDVHQAQDDLGLGPDAGQGLDAEVAEVGRLLALADLEEAGRLGPARGQLGQDLVRRRPDRDRDPDLALDLRA